MTNQTASFLGPEYSWSRTGIELNDVQPLHGGVRVALPSYTTSQAFITQVAPGSQEKKHRLTLNWQEKNQLCRLFIDQDFLTIQPDERPGIPDEAYPSITLTNNQKESHTVAKWAGTANARFDALYDALAALAQRTDRFKPIYPQLAGWQKGLFLGGLGLLLVLTVVTAVWIARRWVAAWQPDHPGWLFTGLVGLLAAAIMGLRVLGRWERRFVPWLRPFTNPPLATLFSLLLFGGGIGVWGMVERWWEARRNGFSLAQDAGWGGYAVWGYAAVVTIYLLLLSAACIGKPLLRFADERF